MSTSIPQAVTKKIKDIATPATDTNTNRPKSNSKSRPISPPKQSNDKIIVAERDLPISASKSNSSKNTFTRTKVSVAAIIALSIFTSYILVQKNEDDTANSAVDNLSRLNTKEIYSLEETESLKSSITLVRQNIDIMLNGIKESDDNKIQNSIEFISGLNKPRRGERSIARKLNDEALLDLKNGSFNDAAHKFKLALDYDLGDQEVANNLGYAFIKTGDYEQATNAIAHSLLISPTRSSAWANLAYILAKSDRINDSTSAYLLTYKYSQNQQKTREFLLNQTNADSDSRVRSASELAIQAIQNQ